MTDVVFNLPQMDLLKIHGEYSLPIIALSVLIACVASFTALSMNKRVQRNSFFHRNFWIGLGAFAMGFGIWSMHFVGMTAVSLPVEITYDRMLTFLSIIPAMLASYLAFYIANRPRKQWFVTLLAGVFMGLGISSMHYIGMYAMKMDIYFVYNKELFIFSILIAIFTSFAALTIFSTLNHFMGNFVVHSMAAIVMGLAVSSMHYIGMFAITYYAPTDYVFDTTIDRTSSNQFIVVSVTVGMGVLISFLLLSGVMDRYVKYRTNYYDSLTILPNRRQFEAVLENVSTQQTLAIWHIHDLERVNRENGYWFGDKILQSISNLLISLTPPKTELYRIEGNRFAFLKQNVEDDDNFHMAMEEISQVLKEPIVVDNKKIIIPVVCAWQSTRNEGDRSKIYSDVLSVLNYPSIEYNHEVIQYDPNIHTHTFEREITNHVVQAMKENEMYLVYQPKINGRTYEVAGLEALLRWNHPTYGMLSPGVFIPILEESDRMLDVTDWVIEQTCEQISEWNKEGVTFGKVAINIPGQYVTSPKLLRVLKKSLQKYNLSSSLLELEITETSFVKDIKEAIRAVCILRQEGFSVALDDFGTGVSSLSYLRKIPISTLKIDKSFIDGVPSSKKDSSIIQAIIALGSSLDLSIVFEGVETEEQTNFLATTCDQPIIQGFYFARPMMPQELITWFQGFKHSNMPIT